MPENPTSRDAARRAENRRGVEALSSDELLALFLKLNVQDPNSDPEYHNQLHAIRRELRRRGLEDEARRLSEGKPWTHHRAPE